MLSTMGLPQDTVSKWNEFGDVWMAEWCANRTANADNPRAAAYFSAIEQLVAAIIAADLPTIPAFGSLAEGTGRITLNAVATVA